MKTLQDTSIHYPARSLFTTILIIHVKSRFKTKGHRKICILFLSHNTHTHTHTHTHYIVFHVHFTHTSRIQAWGRTEYSLQMGHPGVLNNSECRMYSTITILIVQVFEVVSVFYLQSILYNSL